jgi:type II secretory pathway pseudopilin PulG
VVILGILAAIVVPQFSNATEEATSGATLDQLTKLREAVAVYHVRNGNVYPNVTAGAGTWGGLITVGGEYLRFPPKNLWIGQPNDTVIAIGVGPDSGYQTTHGWIFNPTTGDIWAGSFDANDQPYPRP